MKTLCVSTLALAVALCLIPSSGVAAEGELRIRASFMMTYKLKAEAIPSEWTVAVPADARLTLQRCYGASDGCSKFQTSDGPNYSTILRLFVAVPSNPHGTFQKDGPDPSVTIELIAPYNYCTSTASDPQGNNFRCVDKG